MSQPHADRPDMPRLPGPLANSQKAIGKQSRELPRYKVVLHRDDNDLMFVVRSVMELLRFPRAEATHKMWEAVHRGSSVLLTTYLERAELYAQEFGEKGMKVSVEPS